MAAFSFVCSFSLTFPFWAGGQSLLLCVLEAVPLSLVVCLVLNALLRVGFEVGADSFSSKAKLFALSFGSLAVLWGGVYLAVLYPGCFSTDSNDMLKMLWGIPFQSEWFRYDTLNNHHPAFYVFLNYLAVCLGQILGFSQMKCVALISVLHLATLAACCGFAVLKVNSIFKRKWLVLICWLFFLWDPLLGWYSVTMWKDILFSGVLACFALLVAELIIDPERFAGSRLNFAFLIVAAVLCSLLRSNGFLAVLVALVPACVFCSPACRKKIRIGSVCAVAVYLVVTGPLYGLAGVVSAHFSETVGVPLQQIACVSQNGGSVSAEDKAVFDAILPFEEWGEAYRTNTPNPVKFSEDFNDDYLDQHKLEFIVSWIRTGLANPAMYLKAWILQTDDYWSLNSQTWYTSGVGYDIGNGKQSQPLSWSFIEADDLSSLFDASVNAFPFLFSIGSLSWIMLSCVFVAVWKKRYKNIAFFLPFAALWLTFLLAAPANDFRYMFSLHLAFPLFLMFGFCDFEKSARQEESGNSSQAACPR